MKRRLAALLSLIFCLSLMPSVVQVNAENEYGTIYAQDLMEYATGLPLNGNPANGGTGFADSWQAAECWFAGYTPRTVNLGNSVGIALYSGNTDGGFVYEDFSSYPTGLVKNNKSSCDYNGGIGFEGEWYAGSGYFRGDKPSVSEIVGSKFISNYIADVKLRRNLKNPIDTTQDGEYFISFRYRDTGNGDEIRLLDTRVGLGNASTENIYAGVYYDSENVGYYVQGALSDTKALGTVKRSWGDIYNGKSIYMRLCYNKTRN